MKQRKPNARWRGRVRSSLKLKTSPPVRVTDEAVLAAAGEYVDHCLDIMRQNVSPEKRDEIIQHVARFDHRLRKP